jgi:tritrans,polycis-undecaprenyl-diphosphate synthase [geranylgeranyl-diphosphate specific]
VFFCAPYWPEFSKVDFLRAIRTYQNREQSWRRTRARRALALVRAFGNAELEEARSVVERFRESLPRRERVDADEVAASEPAD